ncbi:hypothetical protein RCL1_006844 [Eukaryota sp. TZLM3-RCL]
MPFAIIIKYLSGLYALPWLVFGFFINLALTKCCSIDKIRRFMKVFGNVLLYFLIPLLIFRLFLSVDFDAYAVIFSVISALTIGSMYLISYLYAYYTSKSLKMARKEAEEYIKSVFTNQGALLGIEEWSFYAAIYLAIFGIFLFVLTPFVLSKITSKVTETDPEEGVKEMNLIRSIPLDSPENNNSISTSSTQETLEDVKHCGDSTREQEDLIDNTDVGVELNEQGGISVEEKCEGSSIVEMKIPEVTEVAVPVEVPSSQPALPLGLRIFPAVLMVTIISSIVLRRLTGTSFSAWGNIGSFLHFLSALTVPFGLYFAGAGIKTRDLSWSNLVLYLWPSKLTTQNRSEIQSILIIRGSLFTTLVLCPLIIGLIFFSLQVFGVASSAWFCVMFLNSLLPITSTNVFLVDYGLSLSGVSISVSMSTIIAVPLVFSLIPVFDALYN